jgi:general L-amino acid transport system ATP-binding protein
VLRDISLNVRRGERIVICGPSGSGKSTLIRCLNSLETHQSGSVVVDGIPLDGTIRNTEAVRKDIGMVFQHFNLFPHLSVLDNCTLAPIWARKQPRAEAEAKAMQLLQRVRIADQAHKYPARSRAASSSASRSRARCAWNRT